MIKWLNTLFDVVHNYDWWCKEISKNGMELSWLKDELRKRTEVHLDIHQQDHPTSVIVIGRYKKKDYVRTFHMDSDSMHDVIDVMQMLERSYGRIVRVDAPPMFDAVIEHHKHNWKY